MNDSEKEYRRGYRDGFVVALFALSDAAGIEIPEKLWHYWKVGELLRWQKSDGENDELPPEPPA